MLSVNYEFRAVDVCLLPPQHDHIEGGGGHVHSLQLIYMLGIYYISHNLNNRFFCV